MTTPEDLLEEWTSGETSGMRPHRVKQVRAELMRHTDMVIPRRIHEIEGMLSNPQWKGQITRKLREALDQRVVTDVEQEEDKDDVE